jgi:hypothetical protein
MYTGGLREAVGCEKGFHLNLKMRPGAEGEVQKEFAHASMQSKKPVLLRMLYVTVCVDFAWSFTNVMKPRRESA